MRLGRWRERYDQYLQAPERGLLDGISDVHGIYSRHDEAGSEPAPIPSALHCVVEATAGGSEIRWPRAELLSVDLVGSGF